jgi:ribonuclease J
MRIATNTHKYVTLTTTDTVLLSSSIIPGNESPIATLKDNLFRRDAQVITYKDLEIHASGHGNRDELAWIHKQVKYRFFMPVHGEHHMLKMHRNLAMELGTPKENIVVPDNGNIIELYDNGTKIRVRAEKAPSDIVTVDGFSIGDIQDVVIKDRQLLSEDGIFIVVIALNPRNGKLRKSPDIISRGFVYLRESQHLLQESRKIVSRVVEKNTKNARPINFDHVKTEVTDQVRKYLLQKTAKRPLVIPVILGV